MQRPSALGLMLCDQVIIDRDTGKPSLIGIFTTIALSHFPSVPRAFEAFAVLTDGQGQMSLDLVLTRMDTGELVATRRIEQEFPDPLRIVNVRYNLRAISFPASGPYLFELQAEGEAVCHRRLTVYQRENLT